MSSFDTAPLEIRIQSIGHDLAQLAAGQEPGLFEARWWSQAAINLAMKDERFKTQLFRFVDVLPSLHDDRLVAELAREYFGESGGQLFGTRWGWQALTATTVGATLSGKAIRHQIERMAGSFIAGATVEAALPTLKTLWHSGRACSVDLLGEATLSEREGDVYRDHCVAALQQLAAAAATWPPTPLLERDHLGALPRAQLSIKVSALHPHTDPADPDGSFRAVAARLRPLIDQACALPASIIFDMEQADTKELILSTFMKIFSEESYRRYPHAGIALQAYRKDSGQDVERLITWARQRGTPITIRLVKGAYWDSDVIRYRQRGWPVPLFLEKAATDANYETLIRRVLEHADIVRPAFGTHNLRSLAVVEAVAEALKRAPDSWEYQMIYGMAEPFQQAITALPRRLRIYTPVGELLPGMAYLVRRLLENTSNESFLRKEYVESQPLSTLLKPPSSIDATAPAGHADMVTSSSGAPGFRNEPPTDFSQAPAREAMEAAIRHVSSELGRDWSEHLPHPVPLSGEEIATRDPADPIQIVGRLRSYREADIPELVHAARRHARQWRDIPVSRRADCLIKAADIMRARRFELAAWEMFEEGKPWHEADADVGEAVDFLRFYAQEMTRLSRPHRLGDAPGEVNEQLFSPRGITAVISPWNFPLAIPTGMVAAALVTGNPVLFKPSERALIVGQRLVGIFLEAGVPPGVLQFVPGGPDVGRALVAAPDVATIAFTGSKDVGLWILHQAGAVPPGARVIKRVIAEMGGKNAIIIDETADLDEAVAGVISSFTGYAGQKCSACSRAIVHKTVYDTFLRRLTDAVHSLRVGSPRDPGTQMGPLIDERAWNRVREYAEIGKEEGRLLVQRSTEGPGYYFGPAVFVDIRPEHRLAQEEIFGPILAVMTTHSFEDALELANDSSYALTGGVYSRTPSHVEVARQGFDVGNLYINRPITGALVGRQPFGGHGLSGVGAKAGGEDYLRQFLITRIVSEQTLRRGFAPAE